MSDLIFRLRKRAEIRRQISSRKSVQEGKPDRIADLLEEAASELEGRQWVGLTADEIWEVFTKHDSLQYMEFSRAIEAKLKEKNT